MRIEDYVKENSEVINDLRIASALLEKRRPIIAGSLMDLAERLEELGCRAKPEVFDTIAFQKGVKEGKRLVIETIRSRIDEILGDAQPNPILRVELQELIKKIEA